MFEREDITCSLTQNALTFLQQNIRKSILLRSVEGTSDLVPGQASVLSPHEWSCRHDVMWMGLSLPFRRLKGMSEV